MDTEFELESQKSKDKGFTQLFWNKFNVLNVNTRFFSRLVLAYNMVWIIRVNCIEMSWGETKITSSWQEVWVIEGLSYQG